MTDGAKEEKTEYGAHHHREECQCDQCYPSKREDPKTGTLVIRVKPGRRVEIDGRIVLVGTDRRGRIRLDITGAESAKVVDQSTSDA